MMLGGSMIDARKQGNNDQFISSSSDATSMTSVETVDQAMHRIASLQTLSIEDLIVFFYSKEGQSEVRSSIVLENELIRNVSIIGFGKMILIAWESSMKCNIENLVKFSSLSEAIRMKEDFSDFCCDVIKTFSQGAIGKAPAADPQQHLDDSPTCVRGYCDALSDLLLQFNAKVFDFDNIVNGILGISGCANNTSTRRSYDAITYLPLVKRVVGGLLRDGGHTLLITRWRNMSWCYEYTRLLSQLFLLLLGECTGESTLLNYTILEKGLRGSSTWVDGGVETADSRGGSSSSGQYSGLSAEVHVCRIAEEWVVGCLLQQAASVDVFESVAAVGEALSFCTPFPPFSTSFSTEGSACLRGDIASKVINLFSAQHYHFILRRRLMRYK